MASLFKIEILKVDDDTCQVKFTSIHPDQTDIPLVENIGFQVTIEAYEEFGPFENHIWKEKMDKWLSYTKRQKIRISSEERKKYETGKLKFPTNYNGLSMDGDESFLMMRVNNQKFVAAANNEISKIQQLELKRTNELPECIIQLEAYEAPLFSHLKPGMSWDSAMYNRE